MSKIQKIRWNKAQVREEQNIYGVLTSVPAWSGMLLDVVCAILFVCAARLMLVDVLKYEAPSFGHILSMILVGIAISVAMERARCYDKGVRCGIYIGVFGVGVLLVLFNIFSPGNDILGGFTNIAADYMKLWNKYFNTDINVPINDASINESLDFICFILFYLGLWLAKLVRVNLGNIVISIVPFVAVLIVGHSPKQVSLFMVFIAAMLCNADKWHKPEFVKVRKVKGTIQHLDGYVAISRMVGNFAWIIVAACIFIVCMLSSSLGHKPAKELLAGAPEFKVSVNSLIEDIKNGKFMDIINIFNDMPTKSELTNEPLKFKNEPIMDLTLTGKHYGNIYMKGFHANTYKDGVWTEDTGQLTDSLKKEGISKKEFINELARYTGDNVLGAYGEKNMLDTGRGVKLDIRYRNKSDKRAYIPYFAYVSDKNIVSKGEGLFIKKNSLSSLDVELWQWGGSYEQYYNFIQNSKENKWSEWYDTYVKEAFTEVPEHLEHTVSYIAKQVSYLNVLPSWDTGALNVNVNRLNKAYQVAYWMEQYTIYTLYPPELPEDTDPIEYFLTSKRGYCMHYASAATMLLRHMGVPARYATGYVVASNDFVETNENGDEVYKATVMDNMAHAWVEIYLEGVGWVPIEVTSGYITEEDEPQDDPVEQPSIPVEPPTPEITTDQPTSENDTTSGDESDSDDELTKPADGDFEDDNKDKGTKNNTLLKMLSILVPIVAVSSIVGFFVYRLYRDYAVSNTRLRLDIESKRTKKVIRKINRRMYNKLRRNGKILKSGITDSEYSAILKKTYPNIEPIDWNRYINIAKAATFSEVDFTVEEMEFCLRIWDIVEGKAKNG